MDFNAHRAIEEAKEQHERASAAHGRGGHPTARWVPISAALLAVIAAIVTLLSNQRATDSLEAKNDVILLRTQASDAYAFYEARAIKLYVYQAARDVNPSLPAATLRKLDGVVAHETAGKAPLLAKARAYEARADAAGERAERAMRSHETLELAVTMFEVAIAIVSISALTDSTFLIAFGVAAAVAGVVTLLVGLLR